MPDAHQPLLPEKSTLYLQWTTPRQAAGYLELQGTLQAKGNIIHKRFSVRIVKAFLRQPSAQGPEHFVLGIVHRGEREGRGLHYEFMNLNSKDKLTILFILSEKWESYTLRLRVINCEIFFLLTIDYEMNTVIYIIYRPSILFYQNYVLVLNQQDDSN